jgi:type IV fimbrial biogenesis protein FimT
MTSKMVVIKVIVRAWELARQITERFPVNNSHIKTPIQSGFTLIELMVVVVISAILLTVAVPSFESLIKKSNVDSLQSQLASGLATARTEAASRNKVISICASSDGAQCSDEVTDWSLGWIIFEEPTPAVAVNVNVPQENIIDVFSKVPAYTIAAAANPGDGLRISFNSQGFIATTSSPTVLTICEPKKSVVYARALFVNRSGLVMKSRAGADSIHDNPDTQANLTCP